MFLVFSHRLTQEQKKEARQTLGITKFLTLPDKLQGIWSQIPVDQKQISDVLNPIRQWLENESDKQDLALIQGDFGATWLMVNFAITLNLIPVYSVTIRDAREEIQSDGAVKNIHLFKHRMFRLYGI